MQSAPTKVWCSWFISRRYYLIYAECCCQFRLWNWTVTGHLTWYMLFGTFGQRHIVSHEWIERLNIYLKNNKALSVQKRYKTKKTPKTTKHTTHSSSHYQTLNHFLVTKSHCASLTSGALSAAKCQITSFLKIGTFSPDVHLQYEWEAH